MRPRPGRSVSRTSCISSYNTMIWIFVTSKYSIWKPTFIAGLSARIWSQLKWPNLRWMSIFTRKSSQCISLCVTVYTCNGRSVTQRWPIPSLVEKSPSWCFTRPLLSFGSCEYCHRRRSIDLEHNLKCKMQNGKRRIFAFVVFMSDSMSSPHDWKWLLCSLTE